MEVVAHRIHPAVEGNHLAEAEDDHTLVAVEADHNPAAGADRTLVAAEADCNPAAEADIHLAAVRNHLTRIALVVELHIDLMEAHCILGRLADGCLVRLWCRRRNQWHRGEV